MKKDSQPPVSEATVTLTRRNYEALVTQLEEAVSTLDAIRQGGVDAVVVEGEHGPTVYTLTGADHPYRNYVERMREGAVTVDATGLVLYANRQFAIMVDKPLSAVIGASMQELLAKRTWKELSAVFSKRAASVTVDTSLPKGKGKRHAQITAGLLDEDEKPIACLVVTDLTGQREHARLQLAKEVAERENQTKDAFLAALSHELRTPLTPALIAARLLEVDASLSATARHQLDTIRRNIELEARLIDDLLDLTRIAHGKYEFRPSTVDIHDTLRLALETCQAEVDAKNHQLDWDLQAECFEIQGDPVRLQQLFWNLLRNAAKFTPAGGRIAIATRNEDEAIRISVADNGIGIDRKQLVQIFSAFEQGSKRITNRFGGLGLGLTISRAIAETHQGEIMADSPGRKKGSTFSVKLPLSQSGAAKEADAAPAPSARAQLAPRKRARKLRVLVVEDNLDSRTMLALLLKGDGHRLLLAQSAEEAMQVAQKEPFDLLLCDIGLPDLSGHELLQRLRARQPEFKAIALSGYGMTEDLEKSRRAGFQQHFIKPVDPVRLLDAVAEVTA